MFLETFPFFIPCSSTFLTPRLLGCGGWKVTELINAELGSWFCRLEGTTSASAQCSLAHACPPPWCPSSTPLYFPLTSLPDGRVVYRQEGTPSCDGLSVRPLARERKVSPLQQLSSPTQGKWSHLRLAVGAPPREVKVKFSWLLLGVNPESLTFHSSNMICKIYLARPNTE